MKIGLESLTYSDKRLSIYWNYCLAYSKYIIGRIKFKNYRDSKDLLSDKNIGRTRFSSHLRFFPKNSRASR